MLKPARRALGLHEIDPADTNSRMPAPLNIWSNRALPPALAADFERQLMPHRLVWAQDMAVTNLTSAASDATLIERCEIAFGQPSPQDIVAAKKLRLVCLSSAGYTRYDRDDLRSHCKKNDIRMCNASGVYAEPCAQHVLAMMMSAARRLPDATVAQDLVRGRAVANAFRQSRRDVHATPEPATRDWDTLALRAGSVLLGPGTQVAIVGYGAIARRLVELLAPFGMNIRAFRRSPRGDENCETLPTDALDEHLPNADHVVNILPLNDETKGFFDAQRIGRFKAGATFYNIGRGDTVDQPALVKALVSGAIRQAYLDVTTPEPLPPTDPLWMTPNCHITPHTAGGSADEAQRQIAHFIENLRRYERGEALRDRIV